MPKKEADMTDNHAPTEAVEPDEHDEEVEIEFPESTDCDVDDSKTSREDGDQ